MPPISQDRAKPGTAEQGGGETAMRVHDGFGSAGGSAGVDQRGQGVAAGTHVLDLGAFDDQVFETSHSGGSRLVAHVDERDSGVESGHQ